MEQIKNTPKSEVSKKSDGKFFEFPHLYGKVLPQDNIIGGKFVPPVKGES
ncbi:hypothetical protein [Pontibacter beigongshangensis]|nr:hypothetical protein [Pontibacter beigongshangensis]